MGMSQIQTSTALHFYTSSSLVAQLIKNLPAMEGREVPLKWLRAEEKESFGDIVTVSSSKEITVQLKTTQT